MDDRMRTRIIKQAMILYERGITISDIVRILPHLYPGRSSKNIEMIIKNSIEMTSSLMIATNQAGGSGWLTKELCKMTVLDLISILAPNQVRFIYTGKILKGIKPHNPAKCKGYEKIEEIKKFVEEMIGDFEAQLKEDSGNFIAAFAIDTYKEIKEKLSRE